LFCFHTQKPKIASQLDTPTELFRTDIIHLLYTSTGTFYEICLQQSRDTALLMYVAMRVNGKKTAVTEIYTSLKTGDKKFD